MRRALTLEQIEEAKLLRQQGFSNRQLAERYGVGKTTIWENVYDSNRIPKETRKGRIYYTFLEINGIMVVIRQMRDRDMNSMEVAEELNIPLEQVNILFTKHE